MKLINQSKAKASGDIVGNDKNTFEAPKKMVEKLLIRLKEQYECDERVQITVDELARYHTRRSSDGVAGLKAKLEAAKRSDDYDDAIEKKEMFAKLLEKWSLYSSAQMIFVHILAKAETEFNSVIYLEIPHKSEAEINALVLDRIVAPIVEECSSELMGVSYGLVHGMVYWLAEQCFIRWHHNPVPTP